MLLMNISLVSYSQTKPNIDTRLIQNHGDKIYEIYTYRKDYYNFLIWELDNAYDVVEISTLDQNLTLQSIENIQNKYNIKFTPNLLENPSSFNFFEFNFQREKEQDMYYDLGNGKALKFKALKPMWQEFNASGLNTKD